MGLRKTATLNLSVAPELRSGQAVSLLLGDREVPADPIDTQTSQLTFIVPDLDPGVYFLRIRVDGVDSQFIDRTVTPPLFDDTQQVTVT
jgi:hypothetical protein